MTDQPEPVRPDHWADEPADDLGGYGDYAMPDPPIGCLTVTAEPAPDDWPSRRAGLPDAIECAIGLNIDCGGTQGVHRVRDAVLTVLYREWPWLRAEAEDTEPNNNPPALREQLHDAIEHEVYEYRERTMLWGETEGVTEEIARLATRAAMEVRDQEMEQLRAELRRYAEAESADAAAGSYAGRVEELEARLARVHAEVDRWKLNTLEPQTMRAVSDIGRALDEPGPEHAIAQPGRWLHVAFTSPDDTTANTSALNLRDHLTAEFDGVSMRITSNAAEGDPSCSPAAEETEPNNPAATEATDVGNRPDAPAWTPPPPGSTAEQLPTEVLAAVRPGPYLSTACHAAFLCETTEPTEVLTGWPQRLHSRCRLNNKFTGALCVCPCHREEQQP